MSPCYIRLLTPDGIKSPDYTADSLAAAAQYEPEDGIYTVANTINTDQTLKFDAHLDRLEDSAARSDILLQLDRDRLKRALRQMITDAAMDSVRFRITIGRTHPDIYIISLEPFLPLSPELIATGVCVITVQNSARTNAAAKTTDWMHRRRAIMESLPQGIYDGILLDADGRLLEGLGSNFYAVMDGVLRTAGAGVLPGIAQQVVFETAPTVLPVQKEAVYVQDIPRIEEAFITSSSRGIIPVVEIDGLQIDDGRPGPLTRKLRAAYEVWVADHLETLPEGEIT